MRADGVSSVSRVEGPATRIDEHEQTMAFAASAIDQIRALQLQATPRNFEIFYAYATGHYPTLKLIINDLLARSVTLNSDDIDKIGARFVSRSDIKDRIDAVGSGVKSEIGQVIGKIDSTIDLTFAHSADLARVEGALSTVKDLEALRKVVDRMVRVTNSIKDQRRDLDAQFGTSKSQIGHLRAEMQEAVVASMTDPLTGLAGRKLLQQFLQKAKAAAADSGKPLAVVMGDIDHFKQFNGAWGPMIGDQVLRLVADILKKSVHAGDFVARFDGGQFALVLPDTTLKAAYGLADNVRRNVMSRKFVKQSTGLDLGHATLSFGVASAQAHDSIDTLVARACFCLHAAKYNGRNRVVDESDPQFVEPQSKIAATAS